MILKAIHPTHATRDGDVATTVIANISEYQYRDMTLGEFLAPKDYDRGRLRWLCDPGLGSDAAVRVMELTRHDESVVTAIVQTGWAYIMNDSGDTIEKI